MSSIFSSSWYRVAQLKPRLRKQAKVYRHVYRGEVWYVVQDMASGRFLRLNCIAYSIAAMLDGLRSVNELWELACLRFGEDAPSQDEVIQLLSQLHQANVMATDETPDLDDLEDRSRQSIKNKLKQYLSNPLALRFPLIDPDRLLSALVGWIPARALPVIFLLWLALFICGASLALLHWDALVKDISSLAFSSRYVVLMFFAFPLIKIIHEFGHGLAIKLFGGQCHEMGVMFLVLMPVPYVDATHSLSFKTRRRRMIVGAAGMMAELAVATVALLLWTWTQPGIFKAFLHEIVLIAGVSTILFNVNPLLRLDGYYIFSDFLEIPNLGQKANLYLGYLFKNYLVRSEVQRPPLAQGEGFWLVVYGIGSLIYRLFIVGTILLFVAGKFFFIGVLLAVWAAYIMVLSPMFKKIQLLWTDSALMAKRGQIIACAVGGCLLLIGLLVVYPVRSVTVVEGIVWMPQDALVRVSQDCFGRKIMAEPGPVEKGTPLLYCEDPRLATRHEELTAQRTEILTKIGSTANDDTVRNQMYRDELLNNQELLDDVTQRLSQSVIRAKQAGEFVVMKPFDFVGGYYSRGALVGYVLDPQQATILAVVDQDAIDRVRMDTLSVTMRTVDHIEQEVPLTIHREIPSATKELPSMALSIEGGGIIGLDPEADIETGPKSLKSLFIFELKFVRPYVKNIYGSRVFICFKHSPEPLFWQWYRQVRILFMRRFHI